MYSYKKQLEELLVSAESCLESAKTIQTRQAVYETIDGIVLELMRIDRDLTDMY